MQQRDKDINQEIRKCVDVLRTGGVILYPTDTIWGLGCDPTNQKAVEKIFDIKHRSPDKSLLLLVDSETMIERYVEDIPEIAFDLINTADTPLTIIYDKGLGLAQDVCAEDGSVGIRLTRERFTNELCKSFGKPIVSTSANFSGEPSPQCFDEISDELKEKVDYIADFRRDESTPKKPSGIIRLSKGGVIKILR